MSLDESSRSLPFLRDREILAARQLMAATRNHQGASPSMILNAHTAREILDATHAAWSKGDVVGMSAWFVDDMTYWSNTGSQDGSPLVIHGKAAHVAMLQSVCERRRERVGDGALSIQPRHRPRSGRVPISATSKRGIVLSGTYPPDRNLSRRQDPSPRRVSRCGEDGRVLAARDQRGECGSSRMSSFPRP